MTTISVTQQKITSGLNPFARGAIINGKRVERWLHEQLDRPLRWKKPRHIILTADLFGDWVTDEMLGEIFAAMAVTPQHTYQVLTKRAERMLEYTKTCWLNELAWPLPNVWLGVSVEDQKTADERIPLLLKTQAAVRFLSLEPLLGPVDLRNVKPSSSQWLDAVTGLRGGDHSLADCNSINWVIIGGESGPDARPFDIAWARSIIRQCKDAGVAVFMKQKGSSNACDHSRKGGHFECFPVDLQIREFPNA